MVGYHLPFYNLPTYLLATIFFDTNKNLTNLMVHNLLVKKTTLVTNGHVKIDLSKMTEWSFLRLFKLGIFLLYFLVKKPSFLLMN
jgi:hypothetical protein